MEIDYVPKTVPPPSGQAHLIILEDNDAVIKMAIKQRAPQMRHVPRMHRVNLDWLFERLQNDPGVHMKYVSTKEQIADMFTKGAFSVH